MKNKISSAWDSTKSNLNWKCVGYNSLFMVVYDYVSGGGGCYGKKTISFIVQVKESSLAIFIFKTRNSSLNILSLNLYQMFKLCFLYSKVIWNHENVILKLYLTNVLPYMTSQNTIDNWQLDLSMVQPTVKVRGS